MLIIPPPANRPRRQIEYKASVAPAPPPAAPLVLQTAAFSNSDGTRVYLTFDREIDFTHLDVAAFVISDGVDGILWTGVLAYSFGPSGVQVLMENAGAYAGSGRSVSVGAANGIVAVDDGGTWEGCSGLALPYPYVPPAVLVAAVYSPDDGAFTLTFDRAIDVTAMAVGQLTIGDASSGTLYQGDGTPTLIGPNEVQVGLSAVGSYGGETTVLDASADTGIVAVDDGGTWGGCSGLALPFP